MFLNFSLSFDPYDFFLDPHVRNIDTIIGLAADPIQATNSLIGLADHHPQGNVTELFDAEQSPLVVFVVSLC